MPNKCFLKKIIQIRISLTSSYHLRFPSLFGNQSLINCDVYVWNNLIRKCVVPVIVKWRRQHVSGIKQMVIYSKSLIYLLMTLMRLRDA